MDIEFIKWMCEKAEGFEVNIHGLGIHPPMPLGLYAIEPDKLNREQKKIWDNYALPLLLQRAIEGVNRNSIKYGGFLVDINCSDITVYHTDTRVNLNFLHDREDYDTAKESALRYVYEQEKI